jgi:hypothetical protein
LPPRTKIAHAVGDVVICVGCPTGPWKGRVHVVECMVCARPIVNGRWTCKHRSGYCITVDQSGFLKPWCLPKNFPVEVHRRTVWERLGTVGS